MEVDQIFLGIKNLIFKNDIIEVETERKLKICQACPLRSSDRCSRSLKGKAIKDFTYRGEKRIKGEMYSGCGCDLRLKLRSNSKCPLGKF